MKNFNLHLRGLAWNIYYEGIYNNNNICGFASNKMMGGLIVSA